MDRPTGLFPPQVDPLPRERSLRQNPQCPHPLPRPVWPLEPPIRRLSHATVPAPVLGRAHPLDALALPIAQERLLRSGWQPGADSVPEGLLFLHMGRATVGQERPCQRHPPPQHGDFPPHDMKDAPLGAIQHHGQCWPRPPLPSPLYQGTVDGIHRHPVMQQPPLPPADPTGLCRGDGQGIGHASHGPVPCPEQPPASQRQMLPLRVAERRQGLTPKRQQVRVSGGDRQEGFPPFRVVFTKNTTPSSRKDRKRASHCPSLFSFFKVTPSERRIIQLFSKYCQETIKAG